MPSFLRKLVARVLKGLLCCLHMIIENDERYVVLWRVGERIAFRADYSVRLAVFMARVGQFERDETRNSEAFTLRRSVVSFFEAEI